MGKKKTLYIVNLREYRGGTLVLSTLCATLRDLGYDARLVIFPYLPEIPVSRFRFYKDCVVRNYKFLIKTLIKKIIIKLWPSVQFAKKFSSSANVLNIKNIKIQWHPFFDKKNSIVIYPEVVYGNVLEANNVARWLLYKYYHLSDSSAYSKNDLFFAYREIFNISELNPCNHIITIKHFNKNLYRQYNFNERKGNCYIIYKGKYRKDLPKEFDGPVLDPKMSQEDLVEVLNSSQYCYCYDPQTFYMKIAVVCGCIPILVMEDGKSEEDYLSFGENHYGIAYGDSEEQIRYAIETKEKCLSSLDYEESNKENALKLIHLLENKFGLIRKII
jgi:hypothetical protein